MNITPQASSSSQAFPADTAKAKAMEEAIINGIGQYLGNSQISYAEKIGLCSRLITVAKNHLRSMTPRKKNHDTEIIDLTRLTLQEREQTVNPEWQQMLANKHIRVKHLRIRDYIEILHRDSALTTEDILLLQGMVKNSDSYEVNYVLGMLAKKDCNAYKALFDFIDSREDLQGLLSGF